MDNFQGPKLSAQIPGLDSLKSSPEASTPSTMSHSQTWNHIRPQVNDDFQQLRKLSEWGIDALNDSSPTVVGHERFESREYLLDNDYRSDFISSQQKETKWERQVTLVMSQYPYGGSDDFVDEFQYEIITSQLLTTSVSSTSNDHLFRGPKSILDFHKSSLSPIEKSCKTVPTKYGQLFITGKKFYLQRTIPYIFTLLFARKALRKMLFKRQLKRSSIMTILMISVYLALQQEYFYTKYSKYAALLNLKQMNSSLQSLDRLVYRYHLRYRELTIYRPIALTQQHGTDTSDSQTLCLVSDVLTSTLDQIFHQFKLAINNILPVINSSQLTNYTGIYDINLQNLYHTIAVSELLEIPEKFERMQQMKKFLLCCLLSVNDSMALKDCKVAIILKRLFPEYEPKTKSHIEKFQIISKQLNRVNQAVISLLPVLHHNKHIIYALQSGNESTESESKMQEICIRKTLSHLSELQRYLLTQNEMSDNVKKHVSNELRSIGQLWSQQSQTEKPHQVQLQARSPHIQTQRVFSGGLNLDIIKTNRDKPIVYDSLPKLTSMVDVLEVDETGSDIENDDEELIYSHGNGIETTSTNDSKFSRFTDDQLRYELNQRIMKLALENKQSREDLRKQKSFELMNKKKHSTQKGRSLAAFKPAFNSEESIPVLFELKHYLNCRE